MKSSLVSEVLKGDVKSATKLIRAVEDEAPTAAEDLKNIYPYTGRAQIIGISGAPGVGKSTLIDSLISIFRDMNKTIGVIVVDPSSPLTGGAILGDRVRMKRHGTDESVFIRSLSTRGCRGGLSRATLGAIHVMDAMGKDILIVETVGVGQAETDIARLVDTCIIVLTPGMGDGIQLMKAGILEIADIFVVNKADNDGAANLKIDLEGMINLYEFSPGQWKPQVILTTAVSNMGIDSLSAQISGHREFLHSTGQIERRAIERAKLELMDTIEHLLNDHIRKHMCKSGDTEEIVNKIMQREADPHSAAREIVSRCTGGLI